MKRFALIAAFAALFVGVVATPGSAASFDDTNPCPANGPLLVCPTMQVGQPASLQLRALAGCDIYRWEVTNGGLPSGLSMSSSGLVTGTPTASGSTEPWMTVHDLTAAEGGNSWCGGDNKSERQFVFNVVAGLSIQNQSVPGGTIGQPYSQTFTALAITSTNPVQGSPAAATWTIQSGNLPNGVTFSTAGVLSGTPATEGSYTFVVRAVGRRRRFRHRDRNAGRPSASRRLLAVPRARPEGRGRRSVQRDADCDRRQRSVHVVAREWLCTGRARARARRHGLRHTRRPWTVRVRDACHRRGRTCCDRERNSRRRVEVRDQERQTEAGKGRRRLPRDDHDGGRRCTGNVERTAGSFLRA